MAGLLRDEETSNLVARVARRRLLATGPAGGAKPPPPSACCPCSVMTAHRAVGGLGVPAPRRWTAAYEAKGPSPGHRACCENSWARRPMGELWLRENGYRDGGGFAPAEPGARTVSLGGRRDEHVHDGRPLPAEGGRGDCTLAPCPRATVREGLERAEAEGVARGVLAIAMGYRAHRCR
jgi:hypothetical protein